MQSITIEPPIPTMLLPTFGINESSGPISSGSIQRTRMPASLAKCNVCLKTCHYHHYNVQSCEGCKQFFRRAISNPKYWICKGSRNVCEVTSLGNKCKGCRLDRCLRAGMDWRNLINPTEREHIARLEMRQMQVTAKSTLENNELQFLLRIVNAQSRIMHAFADFNDDQACTFGNSMEYVLNHSQNILGLAEHFSLEPRPFAPMMLGKVYAEGVLMGCLQPIVVKMIKIDNLICVGIIKVMPVFARLAPADKILIARHARLPVGILVNIYCALELGMGTWQRRNLGSSMVTTVTGGRFSQDKKLLKLADNHFTNSVIPFTNAAISKEEFALILAILISQAADIPGLSNDARESLNGESSRYSKILLRYLQCRLGSTEAGAKRFAECIHLVSHCFHQVHHSQLFLTYLNTFYRRHCAPKQQQDKSELIFIA